MKEKTIIEQVAKGKELYVGVKYDFENETYAVYIASKNREFIEDIHIWSGERIKTFVDPRKITPWAEKLGFCGIYFEDIIFNGCS